MKPARMPDTASGGAGRGWLRRRWLVAGAVLLLGAGILVAVRFSDRIDQAAIESWVAAAGLWGPVAVIALMIVAVVASPIPSAPIAMASGAAYGHYAGTAYVAIGAELGAIAAFVIARGLGRGAVERLLGDKADYGLLGSQNALTLTVFVSRLLPFVSFDAMSYAAGLSRLHAWRFGLATLAGILPTSFVLAHLGSAAMEGDWGGSGWVAAGLGIATALPLILLAFRRTRQSPNEPPDRPKAGHDTK